MLSTIVNKMMANNNCQGFGKTLYFAIFSSMLLQTAIAAKQWGYYEDDRELQPDLWKNNAKTCAGREQSPIAINYDEVELPDVAFDKFRFFGFDAAPLGAKVKLENKGSTVVYSPQADFFVDGGGLYGKFKVAQFHLHWGKKADRGSEHTLDGVQYAAEIHFVMYSNSYSSLGEALGRLGGIAVLGVFVKEDNVRDNAKFEPVIENLLNISYPDDPDAYGRSFNLSDLFPENTDVFYRYKGSLTTPPCTERLTWTVFDEPITVSKAQMNALRTQLKRTDRNKSGSTKDKTMTDNYRPIQKLYGRTVYISQARPGQAIKKKETRNDVKVECPKSVAASFNHSSLYLFSVFSLIYHVVNKL